MERRQAGNSGSELRSSSRDRARKWDGMVAGRGRVGEHGISGVAGGCEFTNP